MTDTHVAPKPPQVHEGKRRIEQGQRLGEPRATERPYYCRSCGQEQTGRLIPRGWYALARHTGAEQEKPLRLGLYCSIECLEAQLPRLASVDRSAGEAVYASPYRQVPS